MKLVAVSRDNVYINPEHIEYVRVEEYSGGTYISMIGGQYFTDPRPLQEVLEAVGL